MYAEHEMHGLYSIKIISAQQAKAVNIYKNIKFKLLKTNTKLLNTSDSQIHIIPHQRNKPRITKTKQAATKFRINLITNTDYSNILVGITILIIVDTLNTTNGAPPTCK
jgi:hypothetical protein